VVVLRIQLSQVTLRQVMLKAFPHKLVEAMEAILARQQSQLSAASRLWLIPQIQAGWLLVVPLSSQALLPRQSQTHLYQSALEAW